MPISQRRRAWKDADGLAIIQELQQALVNGDWSPFELDTVSLGLALGVAIVP